MARRILFFLLFCIAAELMGQQSPQFSQNMYNQLAVNPGYAGTTGMINVAVGNRQQWIGMKGAPSTTVFGVDTEIDILGWNSGLGLQIMNDKIGEINTLNLAFVYAKRWEYDLGKLGVGVSLGVVIRYLATVIWRRIQVEVVIITIIKRAMRNLLMIRDLLLMLV